MERTITPSIYFSNKASRFESYIRNENTLYARYEKDSLLTKYGKINDTSYYILNGIMHLAVGHENGNEKSLVLFGPGSVFPIGVSSHNNKMDYELILRAFTDLEVLKFSYADLRRMASKNPDLATALLESDCEFIRYLLHDSVSQAYDRCVTRICDVLYLYMKNRQIHNNEVPFSQKSLANFIGASQPNTERALKELRTTRIIETARNKIIIHDVESLFSRCSNNVQGF